MDSHIRHLVDRAHLAALLWTEYGAGSTMRQIAERWGMTEMTVLQLLVEAEEAAAGMSETAHGWGFLLAG